MGSPRELAERYLLSMLEFASFGPGPLLRESETRDRIDAKRRARMEAVTEVFVELGVVGADEASRFRRRLEEWITRHASDAAGPPDASLAERARDLLERRLAAVVENQGLPRMPATLERPVESEPAHQEAVSRFERLLEACGACRALHEAELPDWRARLLEVDDGRTWRLERERRQARCTLADLRAVVAGEPGSQGPLRVMSAELYADAVILRWHETGGSSLVPPTPADLRRGDEPGRRHVALRDDLGTEYQHFHTNETHTGEAVIWTARFATAVPSAARKLIAEIREERFSLPLPARVGEA